MTHTRSRTTARAGHKIRYAVIGLGHIAPAAVDGDNGTRPRSDASIDDYGTLGRDECETGDEAPKATPEYSSTRHSTGIRARSSTKFESVA